MTIMAMRYYCMKVIICYDKAVVKSLFANTQIDEHCIIQSTSRDKNHLVQRLIKRSCSIWWPKRFPFTRQKSKSLLWAEFAIRLNSLWTIYQTCSCVKVAPLFAKTLSELRKWNPKWRCLLLRQFWDFIVWHAV